MSILSIFIRIKYSFVRSLMTRVFFSFLPFFYMDEYLQTKKRNINSGKNKMRQRGEEERKESSQILCLFFIRCLVSVASQKKKKKSDSDRNSFFSRSSKRVGMGNRISLLFSMRTSIGNIYLSVFQKSHGKTRKFASRTSTDDPTAC